MARETIQKEIRKLLADCVTEGTFWNLHLESGDVIDIWREANRILEAHGRTPVSFDEFYTAIQRFRANHIDGAEDAKEAFLLGIEEKEKPLSQERALSESLPVDKSAPDREKAASVPVARRRRIQTRIRHELTRGEPEAGHLRSSRGPVITSRPAEG
jgi:hypothetical protein